MAARAPLGSSFRDPSGYVYSFQGSLYRSVRKAYADDFNLLFQSGLHDLLVSTGKLVPSEVLPGWDQDADEIAILKPEQVQMVSYPHEWCFSQLKDAALLTLDVMSAALEKNMWLKDASAFNVLFHHGRPIFIDTLSFERFPESEPWIAYGQFCRHFLAPLAITAYTGVQAQQWFTRYIDGVPLDVAASVLPRRAKWRPGLLVHLFAHAKASTGSSEATTKRSVITRTALLGLIDSLRGTVTSLHWSPGKSTWSGYVGDNNYSPEATGSKERIVREFLKTVAPKSVWDLGANTGNYSRLAAESGADVVAWDLDPAVVEAAYNAKTHDRVLPLVQDFTNPSSAFGWAGEERSSLFERGPVDATMALALVHHLAIGGNVPLNRVAEAFGQLGRYAIVEFVPKSDSQVKRMLSSRKDVFANYHEDAFAAAFEKVFELIKREPVSDSTRTLWLWKRRSK